jgi:anti-anti-sigma factor
MDGATMELAVSFGEQSEIPVLAFSGDLDGILVDEFEQAMLEAAQSGPGCVIVDLAGVTYIDSQAFGRLLRTHVRLESQGGDVAIVAGSSQVARMVKTFGADYLLAVFDDAESAAGFLTPLIEADEA